MSPSARDQRETSQAAEHIRREAPGDDSPNPPPIRILSAPRSRSALVVGLTAFVACLALWALPLGPVRRSARSVLRVPFTAVGLNVGWEFYAPNPLIESRDVYAYVHRPDGRVERYDFPDTTEDFLGTHWTARWAEYEESLALFPKLRPSAAARIARESARGGPVAAVEILLRVASTSIGPGGIGDPVWGPEEVIFRLDLEKDT